MLKLKNVYETQNKYKTNIFAKLLLTFILPLFILIDFILLIPVELIAILMKKEKGFKLSRWLERKLRDKEND